MACHVSQLTAGELWERYAGDLAEHLHGETRQERQAVKKINFIVAQKKILHCTALNLCHPRQSPRDVIFRDRCDQD